MLTYKQLQDHVLTYLDQAGDVGKGLDLVKLALQNAHEKRLSEARWPFMLEAVESSLTLTQGQRIFTLAPDVLFLETFWNKTTRQRMVETPSRARNNRDVNGSIRDHLHFEFVANSPIAGVPVGQVHLAQGSGIILRYRSTAGHILTETLSQSQTLTNFDVAEVLNVTKVVDEQIELQDANNTSLLQLVAGEFGKSYPQIRLFAPGQDEACVYRFYRKPTVLQNDFDIPEIPYPYSRLLVFDALLDLSAYNDGQPPAYWVREQELWERRLEQGFQEGDMLGAEVQHINETDDFEG